MVSTGAGVSTTGAVVFSTGRVEFSAGTVELSTGVVPLSTGVVVLSTGAVPLVELVELSTGTGVVEFPPSVELVLLSWLWLAQMLHEF